METRNMKRAGGNLTCLGTKCEVLDLVNTVVFVNVVVNYPQNHSSSPPQDKSNPRVALREHLALRLNGLASVHTHTSIFVVGK